MISYCSCVCPELDAHALCSLVTSFWSIGFVICPVTNNSDSLTGFLKRGKDTKFMQRVINFLQFNLDKKGLMLHPW